MHHLKYADDLLVMCRANEMDAKTVRKCMDKYCRWLGQEVNEEKSSIFFSKNTTGDMKRKIKQELGLKNMGTQGLYLSNSLMLGKNKQKEFGRIKEKVLNKVQGWNDHLFSKARKATLIKTAAQAIPCYTMSMFLLLKTLNKELDSILCKFWWQLNPKSPRFFALKKWSELCKPKEAGGLRFRRFSDLNLALVSKLTWMIASGRDSL